MYWQVVGELIYDCIRGSSLGDMAVVTAVHERCYVRLVRIRREWSQVKYFSVIPGCKRRYREGRGELLLCFRYENSVLEDLQLVFRLL